MTTHLLQGVVSPLACVARGCGLVPTSAADVVLMSRCYHRRAGPSQLLEVPSPTSCLEKMSLARSLESVNHGFALLHAEELTQRCAAPSLVPCEWHWLPLSTSRVHPRSQAAQGGVPTPVILPVSWLSSLTQGQRHIHARAREEQVFGCGRGL